MTADEPYTNHGIIEALQAQNLQTYQSDIMPPHASPPGKHAPRPPREGPRAVGVDEARARCPRGVARQRPAPAGVRSACPACRLPGSLGPLLGPCLRLTRCRRGGSETCRTPACLTSDRGAQNRPQSRFSAPPKPAGKSRNPVYVVVGRQPSHDEPNAVQSRDLNIALSAPILKPLPPAGLISTAIARYGH